MVKKIGDKKIGKVNRPEIAKEIESTHSISEVSGVKPTGAIKKSGGIGDATKRRATRVMTLAEREELFKMVSEEAKKIFPQGTLPAEKREIIEGAVKMAIDSALSEDEEE